MGNSGIQEFFSATTPEADSKFQKACEICGGAPVFHKNPFSGPGGEALNLGTFVYGPQDASRRLMVISATHGIEGYGPAGVQVGWLHGQKTLPEDVCVVMVHLLNPWGVAWDRRENEDNVDVFRNLIYSQTESVTDPLFDAVDEVQDLEHWPERKDPERRKKYRALIEKHGMNRLLEAVRRGQHHLPKAMSYHGQGPVWSKRVLDEIVTTHLTGSSHVAIIDLHTGFGEYGAGMVMSYDPVGSEKHSRVKNWFDGDIYTPGDDSDIPDHSTQVPFGWVEDLLPGVQVTAEILEFGTYPPEETREIWPANHYFHMYGDPRSLEGREWGKRYRRFLYPEEPVWNESVLNRGIEVIDKSITGLVNWQ